MNVPTSLSTKQLIELTLVRPGRKVSLRNDYDPGYAPGDGLEESASELLEQGVQRLAKYQDMMYAQDRRALLVIVQALDAAGKDSVIKHVMSGLNPQGCQVYSFKAPSHEDLDHDYMWRCFKALPERGRIGIFNRSYYEEVLVARVHPEILEAQRIPEELKSKKIWKQRFEDINNFEKYLTNNGISVLKIYLNVSKEEQKKRFCERIEKPEKNWKFAVGDVKKREHWDEYRKAYEDMFTHTSTKHAPWFIVPADQKWFTRLAVARLVAARLKSFDLAYPVISEEERAALEEAKNMM